MKAKIQKKGTKRCSAQQRRPRFALTRQIKRSLRICSLQCKAKAARDLHFREMETNQINQSIALPLFSLFSLLSSHSLTPCSSSSPATAHSVSRPEAPPQAPRFAPAIRRLCMTGQKKKRYTPSPVHMHQFDGFVYSIPCPAPLYCTLVQLLALLVADVPATAQHTRLCLKKGSVRLVPQSQNINQSMHASY